MDVHFTNYTMRKNLINNIPDYLKNCMNTSRKLLSESDFYLLYNLKDGICATVYLYFLDDLVERVQVTKGQKKLDLFKNYWVLLIEQD